MYALCSLFESNPRWSQFTYMQFLVIQLNQWFDSVSTHLEKANRAMYFAMPCILNCNGYILFCNCEAQIKKKELKCYKSNKHILNTQNFNSLYMYIYSMEYYTEFYQNKIFLIPYNSFIVAFMRINSQTRAPCLWIVTKHCGLTFRED